MAVTDKLRAAAFARDKGICAFSGLSVWYLDQVMPVWHGDWVDHIKPASRGGKHDLDNLVCASYFHNRKKLNNSADCVYFFRGGRPTEQFFWANGELNEQQANVLKRHEPIVESDWYFNRALFNIEVALDTVWQEAEETVARKSAYWLRAAFKRLVIWRRVAADTHPESLVRRGLVRFPDAPETRLLLQIANADERELLEIYQQLIPRYCANANIFSQFAASESTRAQSEVLKSAERDKNVSEPMLALLRRNVTLAAKASTTVAG